MASLEKLRKALERKGYKNSDSIISITGFNKRALRTLFLGVPIHSLGSVAQAVDVNGREPVLRVLKKVPEEHIGGVAWAIATFGLNPVTDLIDSGIPVENIQTAAPLIYAHSRSVKLDSIKQALSLNFPSRNLGKLAEIIDEHGLEPVRNVLKLVPRKNIGSLLHALSGQNPERVKQAIALGTPTNNPHDLDTVARSIVERGLEPIKRLVKGIPRKHLVSLVEAIGRYGSDNVEKAFALKIPIANLNSVTSAIKRNGLDIVRQAISLRILPRDISITADAIRACGISSVKNVFEGIPKEYFNEVVFLAYPFDLNPGFRNPEKTHIKQAIHLGVKPGNLVYISSLIERHGLDLVRQALSLGIHQKYVEKTIKAIELHGFDKVKQVLAKVPEEHINNILDALKHREIESVRRELNLFNYNVNLNKFSKEAEKKGISIFSGKVSASPYIFPSHKKTHVLTLAIYPPKNDKKNFISHIDYGALGHVKCYVKGNKLLVSEISGNVFDTKNPDFVPVTYRDWHKLLLLSLKEYARKLGVKEVWMTTGQHQMRRKLDDPIYLNDAYELYGRAPEQTGFILKETPETNVEGVKSSLFWVLKLK